MGSTLFGGPTTTRVPPPNALFPGQQSSYLNQMGISGVTPASFANLSKTASTGTDALQNIVKSGGNPTDVGPAFEALKASMSSNIAEGAANLKEQFGNLGLSGGSSLARAAGDYETNVTSQLNNTLAQYTMQSQEAAAGREAAAASQLGSESLAASTAGAQLASEPALAFTPSAVIGQQPGLLGGLTSAFSSLFPGFDIAGAIGSLFGGGGGSSGGASFQQPVPMPTFTPPATPYSTPGYSGFFDPALGTT